jgi:hypothetical protein
LSNPAKVNKMFYSNSPSARNGLLSLTNPIDIRHRRQPSLACRLISLRFGLAPATAALVAALAGFPLTAED